MIDLDHVLIWRDGDATVTRFKSDGAEARAVNSGDAYQQQIAGWVGCAGDIPLYNYQHEFLHSFLSQKMHGAESYVVGMEARGRRMSKVGGLFEERWCYHFHRYLNGVAGPVEPEWGEWKAEALALLDAA